MLYLHFQKENLILDKAEEHHLLIKDIKEVFQKEETSGAYNEIIFEDFIENEIERSSRYDQQFLLVAFKIDEIMAKEVSQKFVRKGDYYGKIDHRTYAILMPHTSLDKIIGMTQRLQKIIHKADISIVQYLPNDTKEMIYEKLLSGFEHKNKIGIEV